MAKYDKGASRVVASRVESQTLESHCDSLSAVTPSYAFLKSKGLS